MSRKLLIVFFIVVTWIFSEGISVAGSAHDQDHHYIQSGDWSFSIGALGIYKPEYEGSDDYEVIGLPVINITWRDTIFLNPRKGLGAYIWDRNSVKLALSVGYTFGRDEDDSCHLDGLGDIDGGATANVLFKWTIGDIALDARYEQQITGQDTGVQVHLTLGYLLEITKKIMMTPSVKTTYASSDYMEEYFGVSPSQSVRSGQFVYDAGPGFKSMGFQVMAIYRVNQQWGIQASAGYDHLIGDAADSPLVKNEKQYLSGVGLSRKF